MVVGAYDSFDDNDERINPNCYEITFRQSSELTQGAEQR